MKNIKKLLNSNKAAIARTITMVENSMDTKALEEIFSYTGKAYNIGITGPPGAGKSTIVNAIAKKLLKENKKIGIIAVDPTSPFSGGALLGDRIRMNDLILEDNVFIRSMASRGSLGGLAHKTKDAVLVLDAAGMDYILIETIGVGQVELDITQVCDTTIVLLVPESGDAIQAMKAGLLEAADILVINKADREGSDKLMTELKSVFDLSKEYSTQSKKQKNRWNYPIIKTVATSNEGINEVISSIKSHKKYLVESGELKEKRKSNLSLIIHELIERNIRLHIENYIIDENELNKVLNKIYKRELNLYSIANDISKKVLHFQSKELTRTGKNR